MIRVTKPITLRSGIKKTIHVVGATIRANKKLLRDQPRSFRNSPCYTVQCVDGLFHCRGFRARSVTGEQSFRKPRPNGAVVYLVTRGTVQLLP